jgi:hypothetical protein
MTDLRWFELFPPRGFDLAALTDLVRPLASRTPSGVMRRTPSVVFETWLAPGQVRWLVGVDPRLASSMPRQLEAHLPGLRFAAVPASTRPMPVTGADVRLSSFAFPLRSDTADAVSAGVLALAGALRPGEHAVLQWHVGPSYQRAQRPNPYNLSEALGVRKPTAPTAAENQAWRAKAAEPLFGAWCRLAAVAARPDRANSIIRALFGALSLANSSHCALRLGTASTGQAKAFTTARQPAVTWSSVVSATELAVLMGWPLGNVPVPGRSAVFAPAPKPLLMAPDQAAQRPAERVLGLSLHPADHGHLVTMPLATSLHNLQVTGPTGSGKSAELARLILADAEAGHGVLVIEPRGDLITSVLARLPKHRHADVVVIDPADDDQVGINVLAGPVEQAERRADELVGLFRALYGSAIGPRSSDVLVHTALTAARMSDGTLADIPILLANQSFRRRALAKVSDPLVLGQWWAWFDSNSAEAQQQITAPVNNKLRSFLSRQPVRRLLGASSPAFSFDEFFTARPRIVLVNLNRGVIGPEASRLLGSLLLSASWAAAQRRALLPPAKRFPVMMVVDEFQDFLGGLDFGEVLAQCRGLSVSLTIAHQHQAQLDPQLRAAVTANARSRLAFRPSPDDTRPLAAAFGPSVTANDLASLGAFEACAQLLIDSAMADPFLVRTLPLGTTSTSVAALRAASRARYATSGTSLDEALVRRWYGDDGPPDTPVGTRRRPS